MAIIVPDRIKQKATKGEKHLFSILKNLPDDFIVYYENNCTGKEIDFIVMSSNLGLLIIEVKDWVLDNVGLANNNKIDFKCNGETIKKTHPLRQASGYQYELMNYIRKHKLSNSLIHSEGEYKGNLVCPFNHVVALFNITEDEIKNNKGQNLSEIFKPNNCLYKNQLMAWKKDKHMTGEKIISMLEPYFKVKWKNPLSQEQIDTLRQIIHPEITLSPSPSNTIKKLNPTASFASVKVLDTRQEQYAYDLGSGHRLLFGVAGSGKTQILITRAKILSRHYPDAEILLLCFNLVLSVYLQKLLLDFPNIKVRHFDGWSKENGVTRKGVRIENQWVSESNEDLGKRLLAALQKDAEDSKKYDAILLDEAQDFHPTWFSCVLEAMKDRLDGDLIIAGDDAQGIYANKNINWKQIGIQARGRTYRKKFNFHKNYRNTKEIVEMASLFANSHSIESEQGLVAPPIDAKNCIRSTGIPPVLVENENLKSECDYAIEIVKNLLYNSLWFGRGVAPIVPEEIGILYPRAPKKIHGTNLTGKQVLKDFVFELNQIAPTVWLSQNGDSRSKVCDPGVKVQTIHSAKGLQYRVVIILWGGLLPLSFGLNSLVEDEKLMYVGLTRAEELLMVSYSNESKFVERMARWKNIYMAHK